MPRAARFSGAGASLRAPRGSLEPRGRSYAGQTLALEVRGLRQAERIPQGLANSYQGMMRRLEKALVANYRAQVPGRPIVGRLGRDVAARRLVGSVVVGTFGSKFAKALNRGFTSKASTTGGRALRFATAQTSERRGSSAPTQFRPKSRVAGRHFHEKAIATTGPIVEAIYLSFFYDPRDLA